MGDRSSERVSTASLLRRAQASQGRRGEHAALPSAAAAAGSSGMGRSRTTSDSDMLRELMEERRGKDLMEDRVGRAMQRAQAAAPAAAASSSSTAFFADDAQGHRVAVKKKKMPSSYRRKARAAAAAAADGTTHSAPTSTTAAAGDPHGGEFAFLDDTPHIEEDAAPPARAPQQPPVPRRPGARAYTRHHSTPDDMLGSGAGDASPSRRGPVRAVHTPASGAHGRVMRGLRELDVDGSDDDDDDDDGSGGDSPDEADDDARGHTAKRHERRPSLREYRGVPSPSSKTSSSSKLKRSTSANTLNKRGGKKKGHHHKEHHREHHHRERDKEARKRTHRRSKSHASFASPSSSPSSSPAASPVGSRTVSPHGSVGRAHTQKKVRKSLSKGMLSAGGTSSSSSSSSSSAASAGASSSGPRAYRRAKSSAALTLGKHGSSRSSREAREGREARDGGRGKEKKGKKPPVSLTKLVNTKGGATIEVTTKKKKSGDEKKVTKSKSARHLVRRESRKALADTDPLLKGIKLSRDLGEKFTLSDFEIVKALGTGKFGNIQLVRERLTRKQYALKIINRDQVVSANLEHQFRREIEIQAQLRHPHCVRLFGYFADADKLYMVLEFAQRGELFKDLQRSGRFSEKKAAKYFIQVVDALRYLHSKHIIHRDLKPENVLLDERMNVKLADYGWAVQSRSRRNTLCGTWEYLPSEMIRGEAYDHTVDYWALGVFLYEILCAHVPFLGHTKDDVGDAIKAVDFDIPMHMSDQAADLICNLIVAEPSERYNFDQVMAHPWVTTWSKALHLTQHKR